MVYVFPLWKKICILIEFIHQYSLLNNDQGNTGYKHIIQV